MPGPGSYEVEGNLLHEDISNNQNFGSNDRRFKKSIEIINDYPGPGAYHIPCSFEELNTYTRVKGKFNDEFKYI